GEDGVVALGVRDHRNGEDRAQTQRYRHSKLPDDAFGAPLRVGEQRLRSLVHAPWSHFVLRLGSVAPHRGDNLG
ncbi:MAG TPA: hypothetical protein VNZ48_21865, partial [Xanthobacteraceae bacterium]|nr:hypothetical protein [Xanthobacteraceae bacterium]